MVRQKKFSEIIERVEYVRKLFALNKSQFSKSINMKPQSYNNFIGSQGSRPNIELIYGVVSEYKINPGWLLQGTGEIFNESVPDTPDAKARPEPIGESEGMIPVSLLKELHAYIETNPAQALRAMRQVVNLFDERLQRKRKTG